MPPAILPAFQRSPWHDARITPPPDMSADLLVMGAYGHSRLRERIFGGVTQSMLEEHALPILMAR